MALPDASAMSLGNIGADGQYVFPPGLTEEYGPLSLLPLDEAAQPGVYEFNARLIDPVTGELIAEDLNPFTVAGAGDPQVFNLPEDGTPALSFVTGMGNTGELLQDPASAAQFRLRNGGAVAIPIELKVWLELPDGTAAALLSTGSEGMLVLEAGSELAFDPLAGFAPQTLTPGPYRLRARVVDPITGKSLTEHVSDFATR
jgi:hypothetical protein